MHIVVMPGDDIGPEITEVTMTMLEAVNRAYALGMEFEIVDVGMASFRKCGNTMPESAVEKAPGGRRGHSRPMRHDALSAARRGRHQRARHDPQTARTLCEPAAGAFARGRAQCTARARRADRARKHRGLLCRPQHVYGHCGLHADRRCRIVGTQVHARGLAPHRQSGFRIRGTPPQERKRRRQAARAAGNRRSLHERAYAQAEQHKDIAFREVDVDAMAADLYTRPQRYDVLLVTNMFGDILSNEACVLSGGLGLAAALQYWRRALYREAGHGSAPTWSAKALRTRQD